MPVQPVPTEIPQWRNSGAGSELVPQARVVVAAAAGGLTASRASNKASVTAANADLNSLHRKGARADPM
jgi:hypothetical protein